MKVKDSVTVYPYLQKNGSIELYFSHNLSGYLGICMVDEGCGIKVDIEVDVDTETKTVNEIAIDGFNKQIEKVRADAQQNIEQIEIEKQRFIALKVA